MQTKIETLANECDLFAYFAGDECQITLAIFDDGSDTDYSEKTLFTGSFEHVAIFLAGYVAAIA